MWALVFPSTSQLEVLEPPTVGLETIWFLDWHEKYRWILNIYSQEMKSRTYPCLQGAVSLYLRYPALLFPAMLEALSQVGLRATQVNPTTSSFIPYSLSFGVCLHWLFKLHYGLQQSSKLRPLLLWPSCGYCIPFVTSVSLNNPKFAQSLWTVHCLLLLEAGIDIRSFPSTPFHPALSLHDLWHLTTLFKDL